MTVTAPKPSRSCEKCGQPVPSDAAWCPDCGHRLDPVVADTSGPPSSEASRATVDDPSIAVAAEAEGGPTDPGADPAPDGAPALKTEPAGPASSAMAPDGADAADSEKPRLPKGTVIDNKYTIVRVLGEGGMGVVYLAEDNFTGVEVVLKAVRPELAHRKDVMSRTLGEGRTLARIDHPNVVHLNAIVADDSGLWLVMQYIHGESLDKTVKRYKEQGRTVPFTIATDIFRQVLQGVAAAHREGVIHRDLKPANILVRQKDGVAKVTDFGIAKPEEQARIGQGNTKGVIGSLWYMSPEQVQGRRDLDKRVDIYALGILLFELLTGRVPFTADSSYELMRLHVEEPLPKVGSERRDAPAWVEDILARACAKNRDERFSSCEEFLAAIDAYLADPTRPPANLLRSGQHAGRIIPKDGGEAISPTASGSTSRESALEGPRSRWWILAVVLIAAATVGGVYAVWRFAIYKPPPKKPKVTASANDSAAPIGPGVTIPQPGIAPPQQGDGLSRLPGRWKSEAGTAFDAVRVGETVEFRVVDPAQFAPADYAKGEARFILKRSNDANVFFVEEKMRPQANYPFDPRSRTSCQEVLTEVDGQALGATLAGEELRVDFAKISIAAENLKLEGGKIVSCSNLRAVTRGRGRTVLKR